MENEEKKERRGGARKGAGRKPKDDGEKRRARILMLTDREKAAVDKMRGNMSFSEFIRQKLGFPDR